jgi:hypothetical protein
MGHGQTARFSAQRDCAFWAPVRAVTAKPILLLQAGAKEHTAAATKAREQRGGGRTTTTVVPTPRALATLIWPPCCSTIVLALARPMPAPGTSPTVEAR